MDLNSPALNEPLIRQVVESIRLDQAHWNQREYAQDSQCGTQYCFAGWACVLSGYEFLRYPDGSVDRRYLRNVTDESPFPLSVAADVKARELLGFTHDQAASVFNYTMQWYEDDYGLSGTHPTFNEFLTRLEEATGLEFKREQD